MRASGLCQLMQMTPDFQESAGFTTPPKLLESSPLCQCSRTSLVSWSIESLRHCFPRFLDSIVIWSNSDSEGSGKTPVATTARIG